MERLIAPLAPFYCLSCSKIGYVLCPDCQNDCLESPPSRCYRCHRATMQYQVCVKCRKSSLLKHVWVTAPYSGIAKEVVEAMKFERAGSASNDIARRMTELLPLLDSDTIVCHIPTAPKRIRVRGYDQARLIAKSIAKQRGYSFMPVLNRVSSTRQLGASREERFAQAKQAFELSKRYDINGKNVLIVDDVTTSGATIEAAAKILNKHGSNIVDAVVFAQAME